MAGIGIAIIWVGYTFGLYGYCLVRGYNVTVKQLLSTSWPPSTVADKSQEDQGGPRDVAPGPLTPQRPPGLGGI